MSKMLRKKDVFTIVTPIPGFIPRQLAIDILHSHSEVITLNPLVLTHKPIAAPRDAAADEFYSTWYEITERIQYIPGMGKMGSGKISFTGCFHDMPWGLQTHIYAPMNVDLRNKYKIAGNQAGVEPPEPPEIGMADLGVPADGLYLREDIEIKCNVAMMSFVKSQLKAASKAMVERIIKKAELLDSGALQAMIEDGKLKTFNPNDRSNRISTMSINRAPSTAPSNYSGGGGPSSPGLSYQGSIGHGQAPAAYYAGMQQQGHLTGYPGAHPVHPQQVVNKPPQPQAPVEMAGDFYHPQTSPSFAPPQAQRSPTFPAHSNQSPYLSSQQSPQMDSRWPDAQGASAASRSSITQTPAGFTSTPLDQKSWEAGQVRSELPAQHGEAHVDGHGAPPPYNPQSYANMR